MFFNLGYSIYASVNYSFIGRREPVFSLSEDCAGNESIFECFSSKRIGKTCRRSHFQRRASNSFNNNDTSPPTFFPVPDFNPSKTPSTIYRSTVCAPSDLRSIRTTPVSRDITPTPSDPFGLRKDSRYTVEPPCTPTSSPRKRAALYNTPRWPKRGRPSPSPPPETPTHVKGRKGFGVERDGGGSSSIYDEILDELDGDPAQRIWKGIDEEYCSPEGGRFTRSRKLRRQGSIRPRVLDG